MTQTTFPATDKQKAFILSLLKERTGYSPGFKVRVTAAVEDGSMTKDKATEVIGFLLKKPQVPKTAVATVVETPGLDLSPLEPFTCKGIVRVAVPGGDTRLKMRVTFRRDRKTKELTGIFVDDAAVYGHGAFYGSQRPGQGYRGKVEDELTKVVADVPAAIVRYTELTGKCGICNRPLERADSVAAGIGPVCRGKLGI